MEPYSLVVRRMARELGNVLVGLALGTGGARGLAHIGVIRVLEREGIGIDVVAGSSMGSLIAAAWAVGKSADEMEEIAKQIRSKRTFLKLLDPMFPGAGVFRGIKVYNFLHSIVNGLTFADTLIPLKIVASDLNTLEEVVFEEGKLIDAIRASITIPGIFRPVVNDGHTLIDGGITDPVPVQVLARAGVSKIIAVNTIPNTEEMKQRERSRHELSGASRKERKGVLHETGPVVETPTSIINIYMRSMHAMQSRMAEDGVQQRRRGDPPDAGGRRVVRFLSSRALHSLRGRGGAGGAAAVEGVGARMKWDRLTVPEQRRIQNEKLHRYLTEVIAPFSPYYKKLFAEHKIDPRRIKTVEDLRHLPFTSKADLLPTSEQPEKFREFIITPDLSVLKHRPRVVAEALLRGRSAVERRFEREYRPIFLTATTGRSSMPVAFAYTDHDMRNLRTAGARLIQTFGATTKMRGVNMFPYAPHLAFWQVVFAGLEFGMLLVSSGGGKVMGTDGNINLIEKIKPEALIGIPTFVYHVIREAHAQGRKWPQVYKIVLGGEKKSAGHPPQDGFAAAGDGRGRRARVRHVRVYRGAHGVGRMSAAAGRMERVPFVPRSRHFRGDRSRNRRGEGRRRAGRTGVHAARCAGDGGAAVSDG